MAAAQADSQSGLAPSQGTLTQDSAGRPLESDATAAVPPTSADLRQAFGENIKDCYFDLDRATVREEDRATLARDAEWLKAHPNVFFTVEGAADERGAIVYNLVLSDKRALATRDALVGMGVPEQQILFATGWGKLYPVCNQSDEACWSQNRRSHLAPWPPDDILSRGYPAEAASLRKAAKASDTN
jgi:peptidoglycan-associated lipoprotein